MVKYLGGIYFIVKLFSKFKKEKLGLLWVLVGGTPAWVVYTAEQLESQYTSSLFLLIIKNGDQFLSNSEVQAMNTR